MSSLYKPPQDYEEFFKSSSVSQQGKIKTHYTKNFN